MGLHTDRNSDLDLHRETPSRGDQFADVLLDRIRMGTFSEEDARRFVSRMIAAGFGPEDPSTPFTLQNTNRIEVKGIILEPRNRLLTFPDGRLVKDIPGKEVSVLGLLMSNHPYALTRGQIIEFSGIKHDPQSNLVDVYIASLRRKIEIQRPPQYLITVRGVGYAFRTPNHQPT